MANYYAMPEHYGLALIWSHLSSSMTPIPINQSYSRFGLLGVTEVPTSDCTLKTSVFNTF